MWLKKQRDVDDITKFKPGPWVVLINALKEMGHYESAKEVGVAFQEQKRICGQFGKITSANWWVHFIYGAFSGYGYFPLRVIKYVAAMWVLSALIYAKAASDGIFAPSNPLIFNNPKYEHCSPGYKIKNADVGKYSSFNNWYLCKELPGEFTTFSPTMYSLNLILPVVDLQQGHDWAPFVGEISDDIVLHFFRNGMYNYFIRGWIWVEILFGWISSSILIVALSGLVKNDEHD